MPRKNITNELKEEIIKYYLSEPMTLNQVAKKYDLCQPTVGKILKDVPKYTKAKLYNPIANERFFENIDSKEKAYFLGMLISDGNVYKSKTGRQASISITLDSEDKYMLENFKNILNVNTSIAKDGRGCNQIAIRSNLMANDLSKYGVVPRKSFDTYLPNIDDCYMPDLIRGIFDGDGSIIAKQSPRNDGHNRFLHAISFCGSHQLMQDISNYLYNNLKLNQIPKVYDYKDRLLSEIKIQNYDDINALGEWMYSKSNLYLTRKFNIYNSFKNHYYEKIKNKEIPS